MKARLERLAQRVRQAVSPHFPERRREIVGRAGGGDPHYRADELAERAVRSELETWDLPIAYFSEDRGLVELAQDPQWLLVIDPIDGTRPFLAGFESACFSVAVVPYHSNPTYAEIEAALVMELSTGVCFYADAPGFTGSPRLSANTDLASMFWSTELTAHPIRELARVTGDLIDASVTRGAVFVFTSSAYSLTRLLTGQLDAHVDVGHRIWRENPELTAAFEKVGRGKIATLFPYDIAAAAFIVEKAGGAVTDAYGNSLRPLRLLTDKSPQQQCSLIAAATPELHAGIQSFLRWR